MILFYQGICRIGNKYHLIQILQILRFGCRIVIPNLQNIKVETSDFILIPYLMEMENQIGDQYFVANLFLRELLIIFRNFSRLSTPKL